MLKLTEGEKIIMVVRRHWFVMARIVIIFVIFLIIPPLVLTFLPLVAEKVGEGILEPIVNFALSLYIMALLVFLFLAWMDYYLDMWIVTNQRIVDIEQSGLFDREISEIPLKHVQDITIEVRGLIETFLKFGTLRIQTAGEREFAISDIPNLYEVKDAILKYSAIQNGLKI